MELKASGETTLRTTVALVVLATLAVILRLVTKLRTKAALLPEDWTIIFSLPLFYAYAGVLLQSMFLSQLMSIAHSPEGVLDDSGGHSLEPSQLTLPQLSFFLKVCRPLSAKSMKLTPCCSGFT